MCDWQRLLISDPKRKARPEAAVEAVVEEVVADAEVVAGDEILSVAVAAQDLVGARLRRSAIRLR